ncbi:MAG: hypothetical protein JST22_05940 [Bacteroidetes bacterium]|nr:hypothetical protein [Bacteroidota bacterium]
MSTIALPISRSICQLCRKDRPLCRSHIIPEFFYRETYDDKHRMLVFDKPQINPCNWLATPKIVQKGYTDRLLCRECEGRFARIEDYGARLFNGNLHDPASIRTRNDAEGFIVQGVDYRQYKLLQLSILWRAGISTLKECASVQLGARHEERLRCMLLSSDPGSCEQYPCITTILVDALDGKRPLGLIAFPGTGKYMGFRFYRFMIASFGWYYFVGSHRPPQHLSELALQEDGCMRIAKMDFEKFARGLLRRHAR